MPSYYHNIQILLICSQLLSKVLSETCGEYMVRKQDLDAEKIEWVNDEEWAKNFCQELNGRYAVKHSKYECQGGSCSADECCFEDEMDVEDCGDYFKKISDNVDGVDDDEVCEKVGLHKDNQSNNVDCDGFCSLSKCCESGSVDDNHCADWLYSKGGVSHCIENGFAEASKLFIFLL